MCRVVDTPAGGNLWVHEIKFDGYRMQLRVHHGRAVMLMSDCGVNNANEISGVTITLDDAAESYLPANSLITNGVYKPSNYGVASDDVFDSPAPSAAT